MHVVNDTIHNVNNHPTALLPIFRSAHQIKMLAHVLINSGREFTVPEIVRETGIPQPSVWREVDRLGKAGILDVRRVGRSLIVAANDASPFFPELRSLSLKLYGPVVLLGERLSGVPGVEAAFVFGSWALRYEGERGSAPGDVDVLVIGDADPDLVDDIFDPLRDVLGLPINSVVVSRDEWDNARSGFLRQVKRGPLVRVLGPAA